MKENKKAILEILKKKSKKDGKFENLVLNLALQKIDSDNFEFDGGAVYTADKKRLVYYMNHDASFTIPEGVEIIGECIPYTIGLLPGANLNRGFSSVLSPRYLL